MPVLLEPREVEAVFSPVAVLAADFHEPEAFSRTACLRALRRLKDQAGNWNMAMGIWGSAAMELHTGYLYTHDGSDLDLFLQPAKEICRSSLAKCLHAVLKAEQDFHVRVDVELSLPDGHGVSLKELMSEDGVSVLGKGLRDVALIRKNDIL